MKQLTTWKGGAAKIANEIGVDPIQATNPIVQLLGGFGGGGGPASWGNPSPGVLGDPAQPAYSPLGPPQAGVGGGNNQIMQLLGNLMGKPQGGAGGNPLMQLLGALGGPQAGTAQQEVWTHGLRPPDLPPIGAWPTSTAPDLREGGGLSDFGPANYNPWNMLAGQPGMPWSPTMIPTSYDPAGYPYAVPVSYVTNPTDPIGLLHAGQQLHNR